MKAYYDLLSWVFWHGQEISIRGLKIKELINETLRISGTNFYAVPEIRPISKVVPYLMGELAWYFSGSNDVNGILRYSKFWDKIKNPDNSVNSNYGYNVFYKKNQFHKTQYEWVKEQLIKDKSTRKAIILYTDQENCFDTNRDFVCTQLQHFFIRNNELFSIVYIRSSDMIKGLTYDMPFWSIVQNQLYLELLNVYPYLKLCEIVVHFGSIHIYETDFKLVESILSSSRQDSILVYLNQVIPLGESQKWYEENLPSIINMHFIDAK